MEFTLFPEVYIAMMCKRFSSNSQINSTKSSRNRRRRILKALWILLIERWGLIPNVIYRFVLVFKQYSPSI